MIPLQGNNNINLNKKNQAKGGSVKKANIIGAALIFAAACICFGVFICPAMSQLNSIKSELTNIKTEIGYKQGIAAQMEGLIVKYQSDLKTAEDLVFTEKDIATFLNNFSDLVARANMTLLNMRKSPARTVPYEAEAERRQMQNPAAIGKEQQKIEEQLPGLLMQPMDIKLRGEYSELINFLIGLENYKQLLTINNLEISVSREGYPVLEAGFTLRLYTMDKTIEEYDKEKIK